MKIGILYVGIAQNFLKSMDGKQMSDSELLASLDDIERDIDYCECVLTLIKSNQRKIRMLRRLVDIERGGSKTMKEPRWLTPEMKAIFNYEIKILPNGLRLTKLTVKKKVEAKGVSARKLREENILIKDQFHNIIELGSIIGQMKQEKE